MATHSPPNAPYHASRGPLSAALLSLPDYVFKQVIAHNMRASQNVEMADETLKSRVVRAVNLLIHRRPHAEGYQQIRGQTHVSL
ncbi:hypothetical protein [Cupriavidus campinensis]|uniref:hypothetical protein n=1 Tax=Cupriavidus campinensis TaxID=151783 RepID=UPI0024E264FD|nr:hypothetical protein [Cupriavidus campinensis]